MKGKNTVHCISLTDEEHRKGDESITELQTQFTAHKSKLVPTQLWRGRYWCKGNKMKRELETGRGEC
jgi:hypothetical protein